MMEAGIKFIEVDIHLTKDSVVVLHHGVRGSMKIECPELGVEPSTKIWDVDYSTL